VILEVTDEDTVLIIVLNGSSDYQVLAQITSSGEEFFGGEYSFAMDNNIIVIPPANSNVVLAFCNGSNASYNQVRTLYYFKKIMKFRN
jgi:hypothetical protein